MELINITYNLADKIQEELEARTLVAVINDESLKLAREQRAGLNKFIGTIDKQRIAFKKDIDTRFKAEMEGLTTRLADFDKNIEEYDLARKESRKSEIRAYFDRMNTGLNFDLFPVDEWVASYPAFKDKIELAVYKVQNELKVIESMPKAVKESYLTDYDLAKALLLITVDAPKQTDMPVLKVYLNETNKDKVINFLKALGVVYEQID